MRGSVVVTIAMVAAVLGGIVGGSLVRMRYTDGDKERMSRIEANAEVAERRLEVVEVKCRYR